MNNGSIGFSLLLMAAGAILAWAVNGEVSGLDIRVVGAILMVAGAVGLVLSLLFWSSFAPYGRRDVRVVREDRVIHDDRERHDDRI